MTEMESWSTLPVREEFRIKFYLDTNILAYLVDNTYSGLTNVMGYLKNSQFVDIVSSKYVIFEFVDIRKREHYLREVVKKATAEGREINYSSLLKYKYEKYAVPEIKFEDVQVNIKTAVENDLQKITRDFGIVYSANLLHDGLLPPTFEINLSSKISREDSLVLTSAVWADAEKKEKHVLIASNDGQFCKDYESASLGSVFSNHGLIPPNIERVDDIKLLNGTKVNLTDRNDDIKLQAFLPDKVKELIIEKNKSIFLGKTIRPGNSNPFSNCVCFSLVPNMRLNRGIYITIIGNSLDFVYSTSLPIEDFWDQVSITTYPFHNTIPVDISFKLLDDGAGNATATPPGILNRLRETGNLVFINPDGD